MLGPGGGKNDFFLWSFGSTAAAAAIDEATDEHDDEEENEEDNDVEDDENIWASEFFLNDSEANGFSDESEAFRDVSRLGSFVDFEG